MAATAHPGRNQHRPWGLPPAHARAPLLTLHSCRVKNMWCWLYIACCPLLAMFPDPRDHWVSGLSPDQQVPFPSQPVSWFSKHDQPTRQPELCSEMRLHRHRMEGSIFLWVLPERRLDAETGVHLRQPGTPVACKRHYQGEHCIPRRIHNESLVFYSLWLLLGCIIKNTVQVWPRPR